MLCVVFLLGVSMVVNSAEVVSLSTRKNVEQRFIFMTPESPKASVILFAGGKGALKLSSMDDGAPVINWGKNNFLVRTRDLFLGNGFQVAVVDAPTDKQSSRGMLDGFRDSMKHVEDIDHVIRYLRKKSNVPVWLVGTSRGTESAVFIAIHSKQQPDGLILTSSMSVENGAGTAVTEMDIEEIKIPALVVANTDDSCEKTPPEGAAEIVEMLVKSKNAKVKMFSGGDSPISSECKARSYHGFLGIEHDVVNYISEFIKANN